MIDVGCNQGRRGPTAEGSRAISEAILRSLWRSTWPLWVIGGAWAFFGWVLQ
jgi:hypothetical protein